MVLIVIGIVGDLIFAEFISIVYLEFLHPFIESNDSDNEETKKRALRTGKPDRKEPAPQTTETVKREVKLASYCRFAAVHLAHPCQKLHIPHVSGR